MSDVPPAVGNAVYARGEPDGWEDACAAFTVTVEDRDGTSMPTAVSGRCPRCGHKLSRSLAAQSDVIALAQDGDAGAPVYLVSCGCVHPHEGCPDGRYGCGAEGGIRLVRGPGGWTVEYARVSAEERAADAFAEAARRERLERMRTFATQWQVTLGAITGLVTVGSVIDADASVRALASPWQYWYVAVGFVALLLAVLAVVCAGQAGGLQQGRTLGADVASRVRFRDELAADAGRLLRWSYLLAGSALVIFVISLCIRYLAPVIEQKP